MKRWLVVCSILVGAALAGVGAFAQDAQEDAADIAGSKGKETWIPLEDLPVDDQNAALDAEEGDRGKREASSSWSAATEQLVVHALFVQALAETGVDLLAGTP